LTYQAGPPIPISVLTNMSLGDDARAAAIVGVVVAQWEPKMRAETLLRKLHFQKALSDDELNAYLKKVKQDGTLPPGEILILLELMKQRVENVAVEDFKAVSSLAGAHRPSVAGKMDEQNALRAIVSKLTK
jgi:hypothetical protein